MDSTEQLNVTRQFNVTYPELSNSLQSAGYKGVSFSLSLSHTHTRRARARARTHTHTHTHTPESSLTVSLFVSRICHRSTRARGQRTKCTTGGRSSTTSWRTTATPGGTTMMCRSVCSSRERQRQRETERETPSVACYWPCSVPIRLVVHQLLITELEMAAGLAVQCNAISKYNSRSCWDSVSSSHPHANPRPNCLKLSYIHWICLLEYAYQSLSPT